MKPGIPSMKERRQMKEAAYHHRAVTAYKKFWGLK